ncbi:RNA polymerase sigma factor [Microbacterium sp.]|uniref:RNA polymerase sigma factor n=1 Tax=Microbacterium sp. TaxID=51671 RepID=UPI003A91BF2A
MKQPFETVVAQHGATVLRVCRALLGVHDADDAWSETFLAALRAYPALPDTANVEAWLVTIARRKAIDVHRAAARNPLPVERLPDAPTALGVPGAADTDLWDYVGRLPGKQRQAITFRYLVGMSYAEIGAIAGGTADAARRAAADGLNNLRKNYPDAPAKPARPAKPTNTPNAAKPASTAKPVIPAKGARP